MVKQKVLLAVLCCRERLWVPGAGSPGDSQVSRKTWKKPVSQGR